jgi:hypothetical protein
MSNRSSGCVLSARAYTGNSVPPASLEDCSRFNNSGVFTAITQSRLASGLWVMGFNGGSYVACGTGLSTRFNKSFSLCVWINPTALAGDNRILCCSTIAIPDGWMFNVLANGTLYLQTLQTGVSQTTSSSAGTVTTNNWVFATGVRVTTLAYLYKNGVNLSTTTTANHLDPQLSAQQLMIGADGTASWRFNGQMALPRIYNYALSAFEVRSIYNRESLWFK